MAETSKTRKILLGCTIAAALTFGVAILTVIGGLYVVNRALTNFDAYRDTMCLRDGLVVKNENLRYSPGFDDAMWCRFTVNANSIDEVFDAAQVDTSEFNQVGYKIQVDWINDDWWDVNSRQLTGGEVQVGSDLFLRVAYVDNSDGTLTVYIFWFEV